MINLLIKWVYAWYGTTVLMSGVYIYSWCSYFCVFSVDDVQVRTVELTRWNCCFIFNVFFFTRCIPLQKTTGGPSVLLFSISNLSYSRDHQMRSPTPLMAALQNPFELFALHTPLCDLFSTYCYKLTFPGNVFFYNSEDRSVFILQKPKT